MGYKLIKGSTRPPNVPPEVWTLLNDVDRKRHIEIYKRWKDKETAAPPPPDPAGPGPAAPAQIHETDTDWFAEPDLPEVTQCISDEHGVSTVLGGRGSGQVG
jgi:hypothetical protein